MISAAKAKETSERYYLTYQETLEFLEHLIIDTAIKGITEINVELSPLNDKQKDSVFKHVMQIRNELLSCGYKNISYGYRQLKFGW